MPNREDGSISVVDPPNVGDDEEAERNEKETAEDEPLSDDEEFLRQAEQDAAEEYKVQWCTPTASVTYHSSIASML